MEDVFTRDQLIAGMILYYEDMMNDSPSMLHGTKEEYTKMAEQSVDKLLMHVNESEQ